MQTKMKACNGCNQPKYIWKSHGKDKYCKECWYNLEAPKKLSPISKKMKVVMDEYSKKRTAFLIVHSKCQAKLVGCTGEATDVHHKAGRGENHLVISTWLALCRNCHSWVELNPAEAKELGLSENRLN